MFISNTKKQYNFFKKLKHTFIVRKGDCRVSLWVRVWKRNAGKIRKECEWGLKSERHEEAVKRDGRGCPELEVGGFQGILCQGSQADFQAMGRGVLGAACTPRKSRTDVPYFGPPVWLHHRREPPGQDGCTGRAAASSKQELPSVSHSPWQISDLSPFRKGKWQ